MVSLAGASSMSLITTLAPSRTRRSAISLADAAARAGDDRHLAIHLTHLISLLSDPYAAATVAWPCSVSWPFWLVHLTSRSISFSPFSSRLPVTLPLRA